MTQRLLFASGDVGGARTLLPVIRLALRRGIAVTVLRHGHIAVEGDPAWTWIEPADADAVLRAAAPGAVIFASSVKDATALALARRAQAATIKTIHVLDSWSMYAQRMTTDGQTHFDPDAHAVMDEASAEGAVADGITPSIIHVTGQPALGAFASRHDLKPAPRNDSRRHILFVSEPAAADHGAARGYTEADALEILCAALQPVADMVTLSILPHPREDAQHLRAAWLARQGKLQGTVLAQHSLGNRLAHFDGVAGMTSILLYEAWLMGRPVLSLQPGVRLAALRQMQKRPGVTFIDSREGAQENIRAWVAGIVLGAPVALRPDAAAHDRAAENVLALATGLMK
jgi:hypothetical protein